MAIRYRNLPELPNAEIDLIVGISGCPVMVVIPGQIIDGLARERIGSGR